MKHNLLYLSTSSNALPTGGGRTRIISEAYQASKNGFQVTLLCFVRPDQIFPIVKLLSGRAKLAAEANAVVYYIFRLPGIRCSIIDKINHWYSALIIVFISWLRDVSVIHAHGVSAAYLALTTRNLNPHLKIIADIHGALMEEYLFSQGLSVPDKMALSFQKQVVHVLQNADWLIFVSYAMQEYYEIQAKGASSKSSVIPCAVNTDLHLEGSYREILRKRYGLHNKLIFFYLGSSEEYQLPRQMCHLFGRILQKIPEAHFFILSHHKEIFFKHLSDEGISQSNYTIDEVEHTHVPELLQMGDIGFLLRDDIVVNRVSSPTKFAEYCFSGLPVITTEFVGDFSSLVKQHNVGWVLDINRFDQLESGLLEFVKDVKDNRGEWALRCVRFAEEQLSWYSYGHILATIYKTLLNV